MAADRVAVAEDVEEGANDEERHVTGVIELLNILEEFAGTKVRVVFSPGRADAGVMASEEEMVLETGGTILGRFAVCGLGLQSFMWSFKHVVLWKKLEQMLHLDGFDWVMKIKLHEEQVLLELDAIFDLEDWVKVLKAALVFLMAKLLAFA